MKHDSFQHLIDEKGFFTTDGQTYVNEHFGKAVDDLLAIATTPNQARLIAAALKAMIGNKVADMIVNEVKNK
jgi:hypothetical protein